MQEQEFKKLLDKYLNGSISNQELEVLEKFKEELNALNHESHFKDEVHKNDLRESMWAAIHAQTPIKNRKSIIWKVSAIAAIFLGLLATGYFYLQTSTQPNLAIPDNAITLQLENGDVKVIDEDGFIQVIDQEGEIVGKQEGKSLKYANNTSKRELAYNTLKVPHGKTFQLQLSDGTIAHLNAGSSITYPVQFIQGQNRQVSVVGEAYLDVAKDSEHPFIVNANGLNIRVLGTQFNVSAYPEDETTEVVLVEGSVSLYTEGEKYGSDKNVYLKPGFMGSLDKANNHIATAEVTTSLYTSWINGKLIFRNMTLKNIMKKLERHYAVTIFNNNSDLMSEKFNANFGNEPITNVLQELKDNYGIQYQILDDKIIIQ
ncbi:FecR family protein [Flagellimonas onchidii]|uniref:FecR family protein n=1 Tax=Flagellimonas onchidii TaxID=2562684 RepID=UPI0010A624CA|nr:FecR family protein [Allomuricauda onchidii]